MLIIKKRNLMLIFVGTPMVTVAFVFRTSLLSSLLSCLERDDSNVRKVSFIQFASVGFYLEGAKESGINYSEFPDIQVMKVKRDLALLNKQHLEKVLLELSQLRIYLSRECKIGRSPCRG